MNAVLVLAVISTVAVMITAEECRMTSDCSHVTCAENNYAVECHNRVCTCNKAETHCLSQAECATSGCQRDWHCVDNVCRCGLPIPIGGFIGK